MNEILLSGYLKTDVVLVVKDGIKRAVVTIANKDKNKNNTNPQKTVWIDMVFWNNLAEVASQELHKNDSVLIKGELVLNTWADKANGNIRRKHLVFVKDILNADFADKHYKLVHQQMENKKSIEEDQAVINNDINEENI